MEFKKTFEINSIKNNNYENVSRLFCTSINDKEKEKEQILLTIDVHNILLENLENSKKFDLLITKEHIDSDYIMKCIVLKKSNKNIIFSCYGLLVEINNCENILLKGLKEDDHININLNLIN